MLRSVLIIILNAVLLSACAGPQLRQYNEALERFSRGDFGVAARSFSTLAKNGYAPAQFRLGLMHHYGLGMEKNPRQAAYWYDKAAQQGSVPAQYSLARLYALGEGVPRSATLALRWLERLAERGLAQAEFQVGMLYVGGVGTAKDNTKAVYWLRQAADQGHRQAATRLAQAYQQGLLGLPRDPQLAQFWLAKTQPKFF